jgi:hypothetical protein
MYTTTLVSFNFLPNEITKNNLGKIIISNYILEQILGSDQEREDIIGDEPLMFKITSLNGKSIYVGMHDSIIDDKCYCHYRILQELFIDENSEVNLEVIKLPKGNKVKIQPSNKDFLEIEDFKSVLEHNLVQNYNVISKGSNITIEHQSKLYDLQIIELEPQDAVSLFNTDIEVEFIPPADYYTDTHGMNDIYRLLKSNPDNLEEIYKILNKTGRKIDYKKNSPGNFSINSSYKPGNSPSPSLGFQSFSGIGNKLGGS